MPASAALVAVAAIVSITASDTDPSQVRTVDGPTVEQPDVTTPAESTGQPVVGGGDPPPSPPTTGAGSGSTDRSTDAPASGRATPQTTHPAAAWRLADSRVAFTGLAGGATVVFAAGGDGSDVAQLTSGPGNSLWPSWSPDGARIAFYSDRDGTNQVYVMTAGGEDERRLTSLGGDHATQPAWSPSGDEIAFTRFSRPVAQASVGPTTPKGIWAIRSDGTGLRRLTADGAQPAWSPDGRFLAYVDATGLRVLDLATGGARSVAAGANVPRWSPDGTRIAFGRVVDQRERLFVVGADGADERALLESSAHDSLPEWTPDGRRIVFTRDPDGRAGAVRCTSLESCDAGGADPSGLWVVPVDGGQPTELFPASSRSDYNARIAPTTR